MRKLIKLKTDNINPIRKVNNRLVSYNIEMTEVTGGTFWKSYTPGQIAGTEEFRICGELSDFADFTAKNDLMQYFPPINLYDKKLREKAKALGTAWVRVSGSWATKTYYDFDGSTGGKAPKGYASVLTKEQWIGVLDFVKELNGKLLISVSNCEGDHPGGGPLDLSQTKKIFDFSREYGVDIAAAEFMNEPNMLAMSGAPEGYTAADYARDQDIFCSWVKEHYPSCLLVGPCSLGDAALGKTNGKTAGAGIGSMMQLCTTDDLMNGTQVPLDVFSYHYYNGISERLASMMPEGHWNANEAHTDAYLSVALSNAKTYAPLRDKYVPGGQMWVTESGDAGGGGTTWASTYLDVFRTLNELGSFVTVTDGVIFHNTLASSDYGFLQHGSFEPRPNYFAVLLWNMLMGETVYNCNNLSSDSVHVYCHSHKGKSNGYVYLIINNSLDEELPVEISKAGNIYTLSADNIRSSAIKLNGKALNSINDIVPEHKNSGIITLAPATCTFIVL